MKKRIGIFIFVGIILTSFVSAFSVGDILQDIETPDMISAVLGIIIFAILHFALTRKYFRESPTIAAVIAFALTFLAVWGINKSEFGLEGYLYGFGITGEFILAAFMIASIILIIYLWVRFKFANVAMYGGGGLLALGLFTEWFYDRATIIVVGAILLIIGGWMKIRSNLKEEHETQRIKNKGRLLKQKKEQEE